MSFQVGGGVGRAVDIGKEGGRDGRGRTIFGMGAADPESAIVGTEESSGEMNMSFTYCEGTGGVCTSWSSTIFPARTSYDFFSTLLSQACINAPIDVSNAATEATSVARDFNRLSRTGWSSAMVDGDYHELDDG